MHIIYVYVYIYYPHESHHVNSHDIICSPNNQSFPRANSRCPGVVTGASRGIGKGIAQSLAEAVGPWLVTPHGMENPLVFLFKADDDSNLGLSKNRVHGNPWIVKNINPMMIVQFFEWNLF